MRIFVAILLFFFIGGSLKQYLQILRLQDNVIRLAQMVERTREDQRVIFEVATKSLNYVQIQDLAKHGMAIQIGAGGPKKTSE